MHWCIEEQLALMSFIGMIPFIGSWLRVKFSRKSNCPCGHNNNEVH